MIPGKNASWILQENKAFSALSVWSYEGHATYKLDLPGWDLTGHLQKLMTERGE